MINANGLQPDSGRLRRREPVCLCLALLVAAALLLIDTKSSPLYPLNDWEDVNCFMTVGRGILHKLVPYRDLLEQKGPLLYLLFAGCAWISESSFIGVYLLECICVGLFLYYAGKSIALYTDSLFLRLACVTALGAAVCVSKTFSHGGSAEELHFFPMGLSLYLALKIIKEKRPTGFWEAFAVGVCFGTGFWTKYTFSGFYAGLALFILLFYRENRFPFRKVLATAGSFLAGFAAISLIPLIYLGANAALGDMIQVYFLDNINVYVRSETSLFIRVLKGAGFRLVNKNVYTPFIWAGIGFTVWRFRKCRSEAALPLITFACLTLTTYYGGIYTPYYGLIFAPLSIFGIIALAVGAEQLWKRFYVRLPGFLQRGGAFIGGAALALEIAACLTLSYLFSDNVYLMGVPREETPQYRFAKIIRSVPDSTLLTYGFLDGGFYFASGKLPTNRAFCWLNIDNREMKDEQCSIVNEGKVDFVVTWSKHDDKKLEDYGLSPDKYVLADKVVHYLEGYNWWYYLWQRVA